MGFGGTASLLIVVNADWGGWGRPGHLYLLPTVRAVRLPHATVDSARQLIREIPAKVLAHRRRREAADTWRTPPFGSCRPP
jgi:hypothetical protein